MKPHFSCYRSNFTHARLPAMPRAKDVEHSSQIVDKRRWAELGKDVFEPAHKEGTLVHPLLDRAERMFDVLASSHT